MRSPDETVAIVRPHFELLGITRIARQTDLDRVGIACFAAFRPNSKSIAVNQGKGVDDGAARASAVMEAVEYAIAERPLVAPVRSSVTALRNLGIETFDPRRLLPLGQAIDPDRIVTWLEGHSLLGDTKVMVPRDAVTLTGAPEDLEGICQNTNGLASGNDRTEAILHAVCELVERDAATMWSFLEPEQKCERCVDPASYRSPLVSDLVKRIQRAELSISLFNQTTDLGIPTVLAVTAPQSFKFAKHFDVATGAGTHPDPARAALRAITEAAQTRITSISAARDDIRPDLYRLNGATEAADLIRSRPTYRALPTLAHTDPARLLELCLSVLAARGVDDLVSVPLGGESLGIAVVRVLSATLEDRGPNAHWRPGQRAVAALLGPS